VQGFLTELVQQADRLKVDDLKLLLQRAVPEYQPQLQPPAPALAIDRVACARPDDHEHKNANGSVHRFQPHTPREKVADAKTVAE
jgi:hypothetical protein